VLPTETGRASRVAASALVGVGPRPVAKHSVVDLVADEVRRSIVDGSLAAGAPISITALSARLEVSHIPVREALRRLEGQGVIEFRQGRSAVVAPINVADLCDLLDARLLLESDLVARAARTASAAEVAVSDEALGHLASADRDDPREVAACHGAFHRALAGPAASTWEQGLLEVLEHAFDRYVPLLLAGRSLDGSGELGAQHRALVAALAARDPRAARAAVRQHVEGTARELRPLLAALA